MFLVRSFFSMLKLFGGFFLQSQNVEDVSGYVCCRAYHGVWPGCRSMREVARSSERRTSCCRACSTVCGRLRLVFACNSVVPRPSASKLCRTCLCFCRGQVGRWLSLPQPTETVFTCVETAVASETRIHVALLLKWLASTV